MGEVGAHDEQSSLAQYGLDYPCYLSRRNSANEQGDNGEVFKRTLKKRQFNLKRVLGRMRGVVDSDNPGVAQRADRVDINHDIAQRRSEGV
jgi:hypothetical protein